MSVLDMLPLAPGLVGPGASACSRCHRPLTDPVSRAIGQGPVCSPRHGHSRHRAPDVPCGGTQLDLLSMPPDPQDWPLTVDGGVLACGRCGVVLAVAGWTLREALAAVEGHAAGCPSSTG